MNFKIIFTLVLLGIFAVLGTKAADASGPDDQCKGKKNGEMYKDSCNDCVCNAEKSFCTIKDC